VSAALPGFVPPPPGNRTGDFGVMTVELFDDGTPGPATGELPIADYKHLPRVAVEGPAQELDQEQVETLLRYERRHRDRTPVIRLLTARLRAIRRSRRQARPAGGFGPAPGSGR
jgi:hypothetical protein